MTKENEPFTDEQLDRAAEALRLAWAERAREEIEKHDSPDWQDLLDFYLTLQDESDRAIPVLGFAFIDTEIIQLMSKALTPNVPGGTNRLFGPLGPLGSAATRIDMAAALGWLTTETVSDLHVLRRLRNRFAHERVSDGLEDQQARELIERHQFLPRMYQSVFPDNPIPDDRGRYTHADLYGALAARTKVILACALSAWTVMAQLYVAPASIRMGVHPGELLDYQSATSPSGISSQFAKTRSLLVTMAKIVGSDWDAELQRRNVFVRDGRHENEPGSATIDSADRPD